MTLRNAGDGTTLLWLLSGALSDTRNFALDATPTLPVSLAGGQSTTLTLRLAPQVLPIAQAEFTIKSDDLANPAQRVVLIVSEPSDGDLDAEAEGEGDAAETPEGEL